MSCAFAMPVRAQFLKNVINSVKNTVQNRANDKASSTTNKVIDKVDGTGKKPGTSTTTSTTPNGASATPGAAARNATDASGAPGGPASDDPDPASSNGYVQVDVSTKKSIVGGTIKVTGFSPTLGNHTLVTMTVTGPVPQAAVTIALKDSGHFSTTWIPVGAGHFRLTLKTQDGKAQQSAFVDAYPLQEMENITGPVRQEGQKAMDRIQKDVDQAKSSMGAGDVDKLTTGMTKLTQKWTQVKKTLDDIDKAGKGMDDLQKKFGPAPAPIGEGLNNLNDALGKEGQQLESFNNSLDGPGDAGGKSGHDAYDNTVCEYLTMISEACAAFSTFSNFTGDLFKITKNIAIDKGVPAAAGAASDAAGNDANKGMFYQETAKLFSQAGLDAESLQETMGTAGFAGDLIQMCSGFLMRTYCTVLNGDLQETYTCTYRNEYNTVWWQYTYTTGATITLRAPKSKGSGGMMKMKGNIEGNATKFSIYTDMAEQDDFRKESKGRVKVIPVCVWAPVSAQFVSSQADRSTGFGAVARTIVTPAVFNIPIDVDYNLDGKTMKFYTNDALVDFGPMTKWIYCYLAVAAGIPLTTRVDMPINNVKLTLGKALSMNSNFPVVRDGQGNTSVQGKGDEKIGTGTSVEHHIQFSFSAKN